MAEKEIVLCDTNVIIEFFKNREPVLSAIKTIGVNNLLISSITVGELYFGAINKTELHKIQKALDIITHIPINEEISSIFENLMLKYTLSHKLSVPDALIAATVLFYDIKLFTLNKKDFRFFSGIRLY